MNFIYSSLMEKSFFMSSKGPWLKGHSSRNRLPPQNVHFDLTFSVLTSQTVFLVVTVASPLSIINIQNPLAVFIRVIKAQEGRWLGLRNCSTFILHQTLEITDLDQTVIILLNIQLTLEITDLDM
jgi:hypothetical protein